MAARGTTGDGRRHEEGWDEQPFVGRERELGLADQMLRLARDGEGQLLCIEGEAGIGKSRLLREVLGAARRYGFEVCAGAADEVEHDRPFLPLVEALGLFPEATDSDRAEIGWLVAGREGGSTSAKGGPASTPDLRLRIVDAVLGLVERLASEGPLLLAIEDLHWADPSTLRALRTIRRAIPHLPAALVTTRRPLPASLDSLSAATDHDLGEVDHLAIGPLDDEDIAAVAAAVAGAPPGPLLRQQLAWAGGNPLYAVELVEADRAEGRLAVGGDQAEISELSVPSTLALTIRRRVNTVPASTLELLKVASVLGRRFLVSEVSAMLARSTVALLEDVEGALGAGLLGEEGDELAFRHELIRESIYGQIPLALRRGLHREAARVLREQGAPIDKVAEHLYLGATSGDGEAMSWLIDAAGTIAPRSPTRAVKLLERALALAPGEPSEGEMIVVALAPMLLQIGRVGDAMALTRDVLARGPSPAAEAGLRRALGEVLWAQGWLEAAIVELEASINVPAAAEGGRRGAQALVSHLQIFLGGGELAEDEARRQVSEAELAHDDFALCVGLQTLAIAADARGRVGDSLPLAERSVAIAHRSDDPRLGQLHPHIHLGVVLMDADRFGEAELRLQEGRQRAEERGTTSTLTLYHSVLALRRVLAGALDDGVAEAEAGLTLADEAGTRLHVPFLHGTLAWVALQRGDLAVARTHRDEAAEEFLRSASETWQVEAAQGFTSAVAHWPLEWGLWISALILEAEGRTEEALRALIDTWELSTSLRYFLGYRLFGPDLVRLASISGEGDLAVRVSEEVEEGARRSGTASAKGAALRCRGLLEGDPDMLLAAVDSYRATPHAVEMVLAMDDAATLCAEVGRREEAVVLLEEALAFYDSVGATRGAGRAEAALRRLGVRHRRVGPAKESSGWQSLSKTELVVVRLASEGLTNRQIGEQLYVSRRTVETHLAHVFKKLGITGRVQLAAATVRRET